MSEPNRITDPSLLALERTLTAMPLRTSDERRDRLLYACGMELGRVDERRAMHRWHVAAAALWIISTGSIVAVSRQHSVDLPVPSIAKTNPAAPDPTTIASPAPPRIQQTPVPKTEARWPRIDDVPYDVGRLTAGLRIDLALALIDAPGNSPKSDALPRQENGPILLRPTSRIVP